MTNSMAVQNNPKSPSKKIRRSKAQWQAILQEFKQSGQSVQDFCRDRGLAESSFYKWRSRLNGKPDTPATPSFMEITPSIPTTSNPAQEWSVELCLGRDVIVRIR